MHKTEAIVALALITLMGLPLALPLALPCLADDSAKSAKGTKGAAPAAATASAGDKDGDGDAGAGAAGKKKHGGNHHRSRGSIPGKNQVMNVADLSDKQKSQIQAIYDAKKPQFVDLRKQMQALEAAEWKEVQAVLTPAQIGALGGKSASTSAAADDSSSAKESSSGGGK